MLGNTAYDEEFLLVTGREAEFAAKEAGRQVDMRQQPVGVISYLIGAP